MIRPLILLINMIGLLFINLISGDNVIVEVNAPTSVTAGTDFQVEIMLDKGDLTSFSRLMQELPAGLTATAIETANADFRVEDGKLKIIWRQMPSTEKIKIVYKVSVDKRLKGSFDLSGQFGYLADNERKYVSIPGSRIEIIPNPEIDPSLAIDIQDFKNYNDPSSRKFANMVFCIRQRPYLDPADNSFVVNVLINKENKQKYGKIEEFIPEGFTAVSLDDKGGIFKVEGNQVKFLWMNLPAERSFVVSYKLIPTSDAAKALSTIPVEGAFSYIDNEVTVVRAIVEQNIALNNRSFNAAELNQLASTLPSGYFSSEKMNEVVAKANEKKLEQAGPDSSSGKKIRKPGQVIKSFLARLKDVEKANRLYVLEPESGVYFRVQLAAGRRTIDIKQYFRKYNLQGDIRIEHHDGWNKYSVGSFGSYKQARDYRVHVWNSTPIDDAFVSAYSSGKRITVQEALMITNQRWLK